MSPAADRSDRSRTARMRSATCAISILRSGNDPSGACGAAPEETPDEVRVDSDLRWTWRPVVARLEVDPGLGCARGFTEDIGEPKGALAEPVPQHRDVSVIEVNDAPFAGDESRPRQVDPVVAVRHRSPIGH